MAVILVTAQLGEARHEKALLWRRAKGSVRVAQIVRLLERLTLNLLPDRAGESAGVADAHQLIAVVNAQGEPQLRLIRVGEELSGGFVTVLSGLRAGERVLANPGPQISAGWAKGATPDR